LLYDLYPLPLPQSAAVGGNIVPRHPTGQVKRVPPMHSNPRRLWHSLTVRVGYAFP